MSLYEITMQIVPMLVIALFLDARDDRWQRPGFRGWFRRTESKLIAFMSAAAFFLSMFIVAGVVDPGHLPQAIVVSALSGAITLLFSQGTRRLNQRRERLKDTTESSDTPEEPQRASPKS